MQAASLLSVNRGRELILAAAVFLCTVAEAGVPATPRVRETDHISGTLYHGLLGHDWVLEVWIGHRTKPSTMEFVPLYLPNKDHDAELSLLLGTWVEVTGRVIYVGKYPLAAFPTQIAEPECHED